MLGLRKARANVNDNAIIVDVEATPARTYDEVRVTQTMLKHMKTTDAPALGGALIASAL
jgi:hypothetical protein